MDLQKPISITKLNIKGQNVYIRYFWEEDKHFLFRMKLFDGKNSWSGRFSSDFADTIDEPVEDYNRNVKEALLNGNDQLIFEFNILSKNEAKFELLKVYEDSIEMPYGSVILELDDESEPGNSLIDFLINENQELRKAIKTCERRNNTLSDNLDKCKHELEEFVKSKISLESSLYGKFVQLLNEKKKRIQLLEEQILKYE